MLYGVGVQVPLGAPDMPKGFVPLVKQLSKWCPGRPKQVQKLLNKGEHVTNIFLVVFFIIDGEPTLLEGWMPLEMKSMEICETRKAFLENQLNTLYSKPKYIAYCGTPYEVQRRIELL